jgi:hypothetical protein
MSTNLEEIKIRIRKMLNLAGDAGAAQGEIDNALRFARKLMETHNLSEEDCKAGRAEERLLDLERAEMGKAEVFMGGYKTSDWELRAASFACAFVGGVKYYYTEGIIYRKNGVVEVSTRGNRMGQPMKKTRVTFYGIAEDVAIATEIYNELIVTIAAMAKLKWGGVFRGPGVNYCNGFMGGLWEKFYADRDSQAKIAAKAPASTGLIVLEQNREALIKRKTELAVKFGEEGLGLHLVGGSRGRSGAGYNSEAHASGRSDGRSYGVSGERRKKITG